MTTPEHPDWYQEMLDEIIQSIKDDDTANSETVEAMVQRLQELNALGMGQFLARKIIAGNGLAGGGDLSEDRTISLAQGALESLAKADAAVDDAALQEALLAYLTKEQASATYATKADARQVYVLPFTHPGTVNGSVTSPQIVLPQAATLTAVTVAVDAPGDEVTVNVIGGATAAVTVPAGGSTKVTTGLDVAVSGPVRVRIDSTAAKGVTTLLRFREA